MDPSFSGDTASIYACGGMATCDLPILYKAVGEGIQTDTLVISVGTNDVLCDSSFDEYVLEGPPTDYEAGSPASFVTCHPL